MCRAGVYLQPPVCHTGLAARVEIFGFSLKKKKKKGFPKKVFIKLATDVAVKAPGAAQHTQPKVTPDVPEL